LLAAKGGAYAAVFNYVFLKLISKLMVLYNMIYYCLISLKMLKGSICYHLVSRPCITAGHWTVGNGNRTPTTVHMTCMRMGYERPHCLLICSSRFDCLNCNKTLILKQPLQDAMPICNDAVILSNRIVDNIKMCS
jgi:hypothetical protein